MFYVVGSGPSGIAAAAALLDAGRPVTMLDVGTTCEIDPLATRTLDSPEHRWEIGDLKRAYGSTFAYALDEMGDDTQRGTRVVQSFARGGLSNVWGAAVLPARSRDCEDWPFDVRALDRSYAAVAQWMPIAAVEDDLAPEFPLHGKPEPPLRASRQAVSLLETLGAHRTSLRRAGVTFGHSRLAVRARPSDRSPGCQYTGRCLTGCPHLAIWTAGDALAGLQRREGFTYRSGFRVDRVVASGDGVTIDGVTSQGEQQSIAGERVLLACGPLATARIVLHSLQQYERPIALKYQPYFLLPMLASRGTDGVESEALHTLSQVFVEITDPDVSPHTVHLQFYTYNSFIGARVHAVTRWAGPFGGPVRRALVGRLLAVQGYLHSSAAGPIDVTARYDARRARVRLDLHADAPPRPAIERVVRTLKKHRSDFGAMPLTSQLTIGHPGDGNHCGGSFPMRTQPTALETDIHGQLADLPGVHLVDSSVLPSLPATTFTYAVMANADRIARALAHAEPR
jgi:choline dehydrogenase-like flavoprotein